MDSKPAITLYASFTSIFRGLFEGDITLEQVAAPGARLAFGCARDYLFPPEGLIPKEVTWCRETQAVFADHLPDQPWVPESVVGPRSLALFRRLQEAVAAQEPHGHVRYQAGNLVAMRDAAKVAGIAFWWGRPYPPVPDYDPSQDADLASQGHEDDLRLNPDVVWATK